MSEKTVFLSHRHDAIGKAYARSLKLALTARGYDVFLDVDGIDAGHWEKRILTEVSRRTHFLLLLTPHALERCIDENDWVRREFLSAVEHGRNIVPIREESVQVDDARKSCPDAVQQIFEFQIASVTQESFDDDIAKLVSRFLVPIKVPDPSQAGEKNNHSCIVDIDRIIKYAPPNLIGREKETGLLDESWRQVVAGEPGRPHVLSFVALGGEGKTSLVANWLAGLAGKDWPDCDSVFAWSFYSQGSREQVAVSSDLFLSESLKFFGDAETANSPLGAYEKGQRLAELVGSQRALLILDGVEPLQHAPSSPTGSRLKDQGIEALFKRLIGSSKGLCIVTTRYTVPELGGFKSTYREEKLLRLSREAGVALLKACGVKGSERSGSGIATSIVAEAQDPAAHSCYSDLTPLNEYEQLVEDVKGHALTLQLLGTFLRDAHDGDIRRRDHVKLEEADDEEQGGHAFRVLDAYVASFENGAPNESRQQRVAAQRALAILKILGLFDRPATIDCLEALWNGDVISNLTEPLNGISESQRRIALSRLDSALLVTVNREKTSNRVVSVDSHPLVREFFATRLRGSNSRATSKTWREAHRRLYEHLCKSANEGENPKVEDLHPLFHAIAHGCHADLHREAFMKVYVERIRRKSTSYTSVTLGAYSSELGAISCFFDQPWIATSPRLDDAMQGSLFAAAAFNLRALGRLSEAIEPMRIGLESSVKEKDWLNSARRASNLSELHLLQGDISGAVESGKRSVEYADLANSPWDSLTKRCTLANALHQLGQTQDAEVLFKEAEEMQSNYQPSLPLLYSIAGFLYCALILSPAERLSWWGNARFVLSSNGEHSGIRTAETKEQITELISTCRSVLTRANQTLEWATSHNAEKTSIALCNLTRSRAELYISILVNTTGLFPSEKSSKLLSDIDNSYLWLQRARVQHWIPMALLTRSWLRCIVGKQTGAESSESDLNEAWEIASRGPMPLYMADIHLYRARLFGPLQLSHLGGEDNFEYPWKSVEHDLSEARRLIKKHGYGRRSGELEDAEAALLQKD